MQYYNETKILEKKSEREYILNELKLDLFNYSKLKF